MFFQMLQTIRATLSNVAPRNQEKLVVYTVSIPLFKLQLSLQELNKLREVTLWHFHWRTAWSA
ncbi:hypothetical protein F4W18_14405 [Vibrio gigantis]|uniref:Uncharacterized protein n=1 Tax=Vibrio gigantis TaxID=296199 RepID=A0A5M9NTW2_9VIBR|nr:hypothetical protein F4W18_14405 [Vibrio gigantis]